MSWIKGNGPTFNVLQTVMELQSDSAWLVLTVFTLTPGNICVDWEKNSLGIINTTALELRNRLCMNNDGPLVVRVCVTLMRIGA